VSSGVADSFDLAPYLTAERRAVDAALGRILEGSLGGPWAAVAAPIRYAVEAGGKRLRPILCVAAYHAADGAAASPALYELAAALELIHTYSLIHDDLPCMDDDDLRRGRPTTHRVFGVPAAVVAGAALIPLACQTVARSASRMGLADTVRRSLLEELCTAAGAAGMVGGQLLDLAAERRNADLAELEGIHGRKTGALLAASLRLGAIAAGGTPDVVAAFGAYGDAIGLAFQIADDVLDVTGTSAALGKTVGRDQALGKATFPALLGIGGAQRRASEEARRGAARLEEQGLLTPTLAALARYAVERDR
jgi:geranylgeranyl diphosphate synthase, type II